MISKETLKEVITYYEEEILRIEEIIKREGFILPSKLNKVVDLYGVRRSGKTYCLYDIYKKNKDRAVYLDFEDDRLDEFTLKDFQRVKDAYIELRPQNIGKELVFLFDEIQNVAGWEKYARRAAEKEKDKVFVTGSSSKMTSKQLNTVLRGRSWGVEIFPFSFREYLRVKGISFDSPYGRDKNIIKKNFIDYLKWGGFPEVGMLGKDIEKSKVINEYLDAIFFKDLVERFKIGNILLLESLRDKLFSSFSQKISLNAFYKQMKDKMPFSKDSLFIYYKYFLESMIVFEAKKYSASVYKRLRNPAKIYLIDCALCRRAAPEDKGRLLENVVFVELKRRGFKVYYYEEKNECDFIAEDVYGALKPYQVSWEINKGNQDREFNGLIEACNHLGVKKGQILSFDEENKTKKSGINIEIILVWKWLLKFNIQNI